MRAHLLLLVALATGAAAHPRPASSRDLATFEAPRDVQVMRSTPPSLDHSARLLARAVGTLGAGAYAGPDADADLIRALQHLLGVPTDGVWGPETAGAVTAAQAARGLEADGIPGPATLGALVDVVSRGSSGPSVAAAQAALNARIPAGLSMLIEDGEFGDATHAGVTSFQGNNGLEADGVVGVQTWSALFNGGSAPPGDGGSTPAPETPPSEPAPDPAPAPNPDPDSPPPPRPNPNPPGPKLPDPTGRCELGHTPVQNDVPPSPNGCGRPGQINIPDLIFTACCDGHDTCYSTCSKSKKTCDDEFEVCLLARCDEAGSPVGCDLTARSYANGVRLFGQGGFDTGTEKHCVCTPS